MRITTAQENEPRAVDITEIFLDCKEKYRNVFIFQTDNEVFIYRSLGRSEYKKILTDDRFDMMAKEELICQVCLLWPENYDFDNCDAGIPSVLMQQIVKNSYLDGDEARRKVLDFYRGEMFDLDNQITCMINEAFPQFDIEEIEKWDIEKTTKYLSRAEWKLHNLRGLAFVQPQGDFYNQEGENNNGLMPIETEELGVKQEVVKQKKESTIRGGDKTKKLTPEKLKEREEFLRKFPEFANDDGFKGIDGFAQESIDTTAPALRPGS